MKLPLVLDPLFISEPIFKFFVALFKTFGLQKDDTGYISLGSGVSEKIDFEKASF